MDSFPVDFTPQNLLSETTLSKNKLEMEAVEKQQAILKNFRQTIVKNTKYAVENGFGQGSSVIPTDMNNATRFLLCEELRKNFPTGWFGYGYEVRLFKDVTTETDLCIWSKIYLKWATS